MSSNSTRTGGAFSFCAIVAGCIIIGRQIHKSIDEEIFSDIYMKPPLAYKIKVLITEAGLRKYSVLAVL